MQEVCSRYFVYSAENKLIKQISVQINQDCFLKGKNLLHDQLKRKEAVRKEMFMKTWKWPCYSFEKGRVIIFKKPLGVLYRCQTLLLRKEDLMSAIAVQHKREKNKC